MGACCDASNEQMRPAPSGGVQRPGGPEGQTIKVEYFAGFGRADPLVQLLSHKKVKFELVSVTHEAWFARKAAGEEG